MTEEEFRKSMNYTKSEIMTIIKEQRKKFYELLKMYPCVYESTNGWIYFLKGSNINIMVETEFELICRGTGKYKFTEPWLTMDFNKVKEFLDFQVLRYKKRIVKDKKSKILKDFK